MDTKTESGRRIATARIEAGLRQREVCERVQGLTITRLSNWETGARMISVDEAKWLAPVLKVTAAYLLTLTDDKETPREQSLLQAYRRCDDRGQDAIHRLAESECAYVVSHEEAHDGAPKRNCG